MRRFLLPTLLLVRGSLAWGHVYPFPLPFPEFLKDRSDPGLKPWSPANSLSPEVLRTRLPEWAVQTAGGWVRWREVERLFLRTDRRGLDKYGAVIFNEEEHSILAPQSFTKYWKENHERFVAKLEGAEFMLVQPGLLDGHPMVAKIRRSLERESFWLAHPFLFYRPGIRTRYLGTTTTRGSDVHGLRVEFDPGAAPYRRVDYFFDPFCADIVKAVATPGLEGEPVEEYHFSGRVTSQSGLRLPRKRELRIDGILREVVVVRELATRQPVLPPSPISAETRRRALADLSQPRKF